MARVDGQHRDGGAGQRAVLAVDLVRRALQQAAQRLYGGDAAVFGGLGQRLRHHAGGFLAGLAAAHAVAHGIQLRAGALAGEHAAGVHLLERHVLAVQEEVVLIVPADIAHVVADCRLHLVIAAHCLTPSQPRRMVRSPSRSLSWLLRMDLMDSWENRSTLGV